VRIVKTLVSGTAGGVGWFSIPQMHVSILVISAVMAILAGYLCYWFYQIGVRLKNESYGQKLYKSMEDTFRENKRMDYQKLQLWLKSYGAGFAVKGFEEPFYFITVNALFGLTVLGVFSIISSIFTGMIMAVVMLVTEIVLFMWIDRKNNKEMLNDVAFLYDATAIQLASNIYMSQAITNCVEYISNKRLRQALLELCNSLNLGGDVRAATKDFSEKFHNQYLDTFCNVVVQITAETGEPGKLIEDMSKQLSILKETNFVARKKSTENKLQLCIIGIFIVFIILIFYLCIASMTGSTDMLF